MRARVASSHADRSASSWSASSSPAAPQRGQRLDRRRHLQLRRPGGVLQLQQLDGPLDVGEAAAAELGVGGRVGAARQPLPLHPRLDPADLGDLLGGQPVGRVPDRVDQRDEVLAELLVAGHRHGAQQRLHLPDRHPALVVLAERRQAAHQRALPALRPQVGVDLEGRVGRGLAEQPAQRVGHGVGRGGRLALVRAVPGPVHEQDVGVGAVAHLAAAEPAHADDGEVHRDVGDVDARLERRGRAARRPARPAGWPRRCR